MPVTGVNSLLAMTDYNSKHAIYQFTFHQREVVFDLGLEHLTGSQIDVEEFIDHPDLVADLVSHR